MNDLVYDYSFARPDPGAMKASGAVGVVRYLGYGSKVIGGGERDALRAAGLQIALVWETSADRTSSGYGAGQSDAQVANGQADALGFPDGRPLYFATDGNVFDDTILAYYQGARDNSKRPVGPYGNTDLIDSCAGRLGLRYGWKVQTWGGGTGNANLEQMPNEAPAIGGTDVNRTLKDDWGQWDGPAAPARNEENDMKMLHALGADLYFLVTPLWWAPVTNGNDIYRWAGALGVSDITPQEFIDLANEITVRADTFAHSIARLVPAGSGGGGGAPVDKEAIAAAVDAHLQARLRAAAA